METKEYCKLRVMSGYLESLSSNQVALPSFDVLPACLIRFAGLVGVLKAVLTREETQITQPVGFPESYSKVDDSVNESFRHPEAPFRSMSVVL